MTVRLLKDYNVVDSDYEPPAAVGLSREEKIKVTMCSLKSWEGESERERERNIVIHKQLFVM